MFEFDESNMYPYESSSSSYSTSYSSYVDCTLSLGTPSTRLVDHSNTDRTTHHEPPRASSKPNRFWGGFGSKNTPSNNQRSNDSLLARRCANCDTTSTPLWRNGPRGPKSLCNACGIRFKKEERRAAAAAAANGGSATVEIDPHHTMNSSWVQDSHAQMYPCYSSGPYGGDFSYTDGADQDRDGADTSFGFMPWRHNVSDRPSFVHDYSR